MDSILYSTLHRRPRVCKNRAIEYKKGRFLNVIFYHIKLRNFESIRRYRNEASMLGVLYLYA